MLEIERFHDRVGCGESWQKGSPVDQLLWSYERYLTLGEDYFSFRILSHVSGKVSALGYHSYCLRSTSTAALHYFLERAM